MATRWKPSRIGAEAWQTLDRAGDQHWLRGRAGNLARETLQKTVLFPATRFVARPTVRGADDLHATPQPAIIAANHSSDLDTPLILDALVPLEAFLSPDHPSAEDEEAFEAACVLHRGAGTLEDSIGLGDLLVDAGDLFAIGSAPALGRNKLLLELETAHLLLAHTLGERKSGNPAEQGGAANGEHG